MKTFIVHYTQTGSVEIKAENEEEAQELYFAGEGENIKTKEDFRITEVTKGGDQT